MVKYASKNFLSRREFLRKLTTMGGAAALTAFLESCSSADDDQEVVLSPTALLKTLTATTVTPTSAPSAAETNQPARTMAEPTATAANITDDGKARVAFVKTNNRAEGVRQAVELLGINPVEGKSVFLKPNFNSSDPAPGSTHLDVLASLVKTLKDMGAQQITVGDRSGMGNTRQVMDRLGVFRLAEEIGFSTLVFDELGVEEWVRIEPSNGHWQQGFAIARTCLEAVVVQTCCLKTHRYGGHFTLSLKNSVGMVAKRLPSLDHDFMQELHSSPHQRRMIAEINSAYTPALIVMDGVEAFISGGPDVGEKVFPEVILAGTDRIAMDAVGIALLRHFGCKTEAAKGRIFEQEQIARAVELGLGIDSPEKIDFLTGDPDSAIYSGIIQELLING